MCDVPAGSFQMGCNTAVDTECQSNENPYHQVTVPTFKIDKYEVTASEYLGTPPYRSMVWRRGVRSVLLDAVEGLGRSGPNTPAQCLLTGT